MRFEVRGGQWDYPGKFIAFSKLEIEGDKLVFRNDELMPPWGRRSVSASGFDILKSLALSVVIFAVCYYFSHIWILWFSFIPLLFQLLGNASRRPAAGGYTGGSENREVLVPLIAVRNPGGGGATVAFGLDVPDAPLEVSVVVRMEDEAEAERLRFELLRAAPR